MVIHIIPNTQVMPRRMARRLAAKATHDVAEAEEPVAPQAQPKPKGASTPAPTK